jgi:C1A family cysteine protease
MLSYHKYIPLAKLQKRVNKRLHLVKTMKQTVELLPSELSLNEYRNFIYDQGLLGSCTSNAFCMAYRILNNINKTNIDFEPSRLFFYYQERFIEGTTMEDSGADVIDGTSYVKEHGICSEKLWPYDITKYSTPPLADAYTEATQYKISSYAVLPNGVEVINQIKHSIYNKQPVLIGIQVYDSFEAEDVAKTGHIKIPDIYKENCLGGHEMCLIGYNDKTQCFTVVNSWGETWGDKGLCYIPYNYLSDLDLAIEFTVFTI